MKHVCWSVLALAAFAAPALADDVTKEDVVKLAKAGITDEIIIKFLASKEAKLDLSVAEVVELKTAGVSEGVITHILKTADHPKSHDHAKSHGAKKEAAPKPTSPPPALRSDLPRTTYIPYSSSRSYRTYTAPNTYYSYPSTSYSSRAHTYPHHSYGHRSYGHRSYGHRGGRHGGRHGGVH